jgi:hypothetical protein
MRARRYGDRIYRNTPYSISGRFVVPSAMSVQNSDLALFGPVAPYVNLPSEQQSDQVVVKIETLLV